MKNLFLVILVLGFSGSVFGGEPKTGDWPLTSGSLKTMVCAAFGEEAGIKDPNYYSNCHKHDFRVVTKWLSDTPHPEFGEKGVSRLDILAKKPRCSAEATWEDEAIYVDRKGDFQKKKKGWKITFLACE